MKMNRVDLDTLTEAKENSNASISVNNDSAVLLNQMIEEKWNSIDKCKSLLHNLISDGLASKELEDTLSSIIDDEDIHIGMLEKLMSNLGMNITDKEVAKREVIEPELVPEDSFNNECDDCCIDNASEGNKVCDGIDIIGTTNNGILLSIDVPIHESMEEERKIPQSTKPVSDSDIITIDNDDDPLPVDVTADMVDDMLGIQKEQNKE